MRRACNSRLRTLARVKGSRYCCGSSIRCVVACRGREALALGYSLFLRIARNHLGEHVDDVVGLDSFGLGVEIGDDAMAQYRRCHSPYVFAGNIETAVENCPRLGAQNEIL